MLQLIFIHYCDKQFVIESCFVHDQARVKTSCRSNCVVRSNIKRMCWLLPLTSFNKIAIQATAQMAADKEAVGLSKVDM